MEMIIETDIWKFQFFFGQVKLQEGEGENQK